MCQHSSFLGRCAFFTRLVFFWGRTASGFMCNMIMTMEIQIDSCRSLVVKGHFCLILTVSQVAIIRYRALCVRLGGSWG